MSIGTRNRSRASSRTVAVVLAVWLIIGVLAAAQRGYLSGGEPNCGKLGTLAVTVVAGPLNYVGLNPKMDCETPRPSR